MTSLFCSGQKVSAAGHSASLRWTLALALCTAPFALSCEASSDSDDASSGTGGAASGGVSSTSGGTSSTSGGASSGGSSSGGSSSGGASSGGASSGGASSGGSSSGGANSGGGTGACTANVDCQLDPPPTTGDPRQDCVNRINQFRQECLCLAPLERWTEGESCADEQAEYDAASNQPHAGFSDQICEPGGWGQNECPGYRSEQQVIGLCLQQMWSEGPPPSESCSGQCFQEHGHFINMTNPDFKRVACGFFTTASGDLWAVQNFSN